MGIKTDIICSCCFKSAALKNLPTTWGLRLFMSMRSHAVAFSEKPPHHMGIKTVSAHIFGAMP